MSSSAVFQWWRNLWQLNKHIWLQFDLKWEIAFCLGRWEGLQAIWKVMIYLRKSGIRTHFCYWASIFFCENMEQKCYSEVCWERQFQLIIHTHPLDTLVGLYLPEDNTVSWWGADGWLQQLYSSDVLICFLALHVWAFFLFTLKRYQMFPAKLSVKSCYWACFSSNTPTKPNPYVKHGASFH